VLTRDDERQARTAPRDRRPSTPPSRHAIDLGSVREDRDVGGIRHPFVTATVFDGLEPPHLFIVDEIRLNVALGDAFFLKQE